MKGYLVWSLVVLLALIVIGCRTAAETTPPAVKPVSNVATATPTSPVQESLLDQVPNGYSELVRWDVTGLLASQGTEALKQDFRSEWNWIEGHGLKIEEVSEIVQAVDHDGNTLLLFAGQFDWDLIHNHLYYEGFVDSTYRDVEIWKHPEQDVVFGLLPDRDQIVASPSGSVAVRDKIRALERGSGFLFEDVNPDTKLALARAKKGVHLVWEEGCAGLDQRGCEITAYGAQWGTDEFTVELVWLFGFQDVSSAGTASKMLASFFAESMPREVQVSEINQEGQFVIVEASIDKDQFSFLTSATKMVIRPEPEVFPRPEPTPTPAALGMPDQLDPFHASQIQPPDGLVSWWPGDGNTNDIISSNHGVMRGGVKFVPGLIGPAFLLDGENDVLKVSDNPSLNLGGDLTIELWAKRTAPGGPAQLIAKGSADKDAPSVFSLGFDRNHPRGMFQRADASQVSVYAQSVTENEFHHYAYVRSGSTHKIFVDGELIKTTVFTGDAGDSSSSPLTIGAIKDDSSPSGFSQFFGGLIDEVSVYNRALEDTEIMSVFDAGVAGKVKPISAFCREWNLSKEFRVTPYQENPNRDGCGNLDVWYFLESDPYESHVNNPAKYSRLGSFAPYMQFIPGLEYWQGSISRAGSVDRWPAIGLNTTGDSQNLQGMIWPSREILIQPHPNKIVIVGWQSPIAGPVTVSGELKDLHAGCSGGILWLLNHFDGQTSTTVASGSVNNGGSQAFQTGFGGRSLSGLEVSRGDFLYLVINPVQ